MIDKVNSHPVYGNEHISLMARSGRKDLVTDEHARLLAEAKASQEHDETLIAAANIEYDKMKAAKLKDLEKEA